MRRFPETPWHADVDDGFAGGHLWILELLDGLALRFQLQSNGALVFGDRTTTFDPGDSPMAYRAGIRHVRERLDRDRLRAAVDDVESITFFGVVPCARRIEYDWDRTPAFLATDVWSRTDDRLLSPDVVARVVDRLGLESAPAFEKEVDATHLDVADYDIPPSTCHDGPAKGAIFRDKTGGRACRLDPSYADLIEAGAGEPSTSDPETLAERFVTERRLDRVARALEDQGRPVTFEAVYERVFERIVREEYRTLFRVGGDDTPFVDAGDPRTDLQSFRSEVAARTQELFRRLDES